MPTAGPKGPTKSLAPGLRDGGSKDVGQTFEPDCQARKPALRRVPALPSNGQRRKKRGTVGLKNGRQNGTGRATARPVQNGKAHSFGLDLPRRERGLGG